MQSDPGLPRHVGIIMDGNGRWAQARGLPRIEGHRMGARTARSVVEWANDAGIRVLSLYAFSTENWRRPPDEIRGLMSLLATLLPQNIPDMMKHRVRLSVLGDWEALPARARRALAEAVEKTEANTGVRVVLCLNYGGQQEIVAAVNNLIRELAAGGCEANKLVPMDAAAFRKHLWCADLPEVDLIIRTGGEQRLSNFMLWDAAYAELYFTETYWPDFDRAEFERALAAYRQRERRFGRVPGQMGSDRA